MRLPQAAFLACATAAIVATVWYMASFSSMDSSKWNLPAQFGGDKKQNTGAATATHLSISSFSHVPVPTSTTPIQSLSDTEMQIERLQEALRQKEQELQQKTNEFKSKEESYKQLEEQKNKEVAARLEAIKITQEALAKEKQAAKLKKEEEDKKKQEEEEKKKLEEEKKQKIKEKQDQARKEITDAYYVIRDRMLLEEHKLLEPILIPEEDRHLFVDKNNKLVPNGKQILLLSAFDGAGSTANNLTELVMNNRQEYADYHGYHHLFVNTTKYKKDDPLKRKAVWMKLPAIKEAFERYPGVEWIWWVDTDIIIMNEMIDLAEHLLNPYILSHRLTYGRPVNDLGDHFSGSLYPSQEHVDIDNIDIIFTQDHLGINAGSFFIKRSWFAEFTLDMWGDPWLIEQHFNREEQDAFIYLFTNHKTVFHHTGLVPQRMMNAYHNYQLHTANWRPGDLCIHFAGHNKGPAFERNFADYWNKRTRVPKEFQIDAKEEPEEVKIKEPEEEKKEP